MYLKKFSTLYFLLLLWNNLFSQEIENSSMIDSLETTTEQTGREMFTTFDISYSNDEGNTDFQSLYYGFNFVLIGDLGPFKDTEFLFDFSRTDDQLDGKPFTDDQALTLKFDIWANQRFSPFLFLQKSFDNTVGLKNRLNYGIGGKVGLFKGLSISYAFLAESETYNTFYGYTDSVATDYYVYTDSVWYGEYIYTDSVLLDESYYYYENDPGYNTFVYTDSTLIDAWSVGTDSTVDGQTYTRTDSLDLGGKNNFFRHSFRPKIKLKLFDENVVFDYRLYYKPKVDDFEDFLLEHELKVTLSTFYDALSLNLNFTNKYNSRYDPNRNKNKGVANLYDMNDQNLTIGFEFMF